MASHPGNAHSSEHAIGANAQRAIDLAGDALLRSFGSAAEDVTFTPGASAALWLAVEDAIGRVASRPAHIAATAVEHPALISSLRRAEADGRIRLTMIPVDGMALPSLDAIESAVADGVDLLCTMAANNEVGTITDLSAIGAIVAHAGARHLVDASQAAGRIDMAHMVNADLLVVSGAKMYGPRRVGALIGSLCNHAVSLAHDVFGSPDAAAAVALGFAAELRAIERDKDEARLATLRDALQARLLATVPGLRINGAAASRLAGSLHVSTPHLPGDVAVSRLWGRVAVSTGAACQSGVPGPSHVLSAMALPVWAREGAIRVGLGRFNTEAEVEEGGQLIAAALNTTECSRRYA